MSDSDDSSGPSAGRERVTEWVHSANRGRECVIEDVERFRDATVQERVDALRVLLRTAEATVGDRAVRSPRDDEEKWRRWMDPSRGRPG